MNNEAQTPLIQNPIPPQNTLQTQNATQTQQIPGTNVPAQIQSVRASPELNLLIQSMIDKTLANGNKPQLVDEQITDMTNLEDLDRIPDIVKAIRDFSGNRSEYNAWRKSVEQIFNIYGHLRGTAKYYGIISVIRAKIIGSANSALTSHNTPLNWTAIKQCLDTHYADQRDIGTLEYQLITMVQGKDNIETFYKKIFGHLTLVINNITSMELNKTAENILINSYRNKALDTFVRGLNGDLPRLLSVREPTDLPQALSLCTKLANQDYRSNYAHNSHRAYIPPQIAPPPYINQNNFNSFQRRDIPLQHSFAPPPPPRIWRDIQFQNHSPQRPYTHNSYQMPQYNANQAQAYNRPMTYNQQNPPPRPFGPKPLPPPEPMEVDHSIRSQAINYANRPTFYPPVVNKRLPQTQISNYHQPKKTRNFHINNIETTDNMQCGNVTDQDYQEIENDYQFQEYVDQYTQYEDAQYTAESVDVSDIHFLG